jgi:glutathione synthase/RimK-type ligase-like ATP-grasp enzyme
MMIYPPLVSVCNPENRRAAFFREAAVAIGYPPPIEIAWDDLLSDRVRLADVIPPGSLVRIESPGENEAVDAALTARGRDENRPAPRSLMEYGEIGSPAAWFRGFSRTLEQIEAKLTPLDVTWMNHPAEIPVLFDKSHCQQALRAAGIPTPTLQGAISCYEELRTRMRDSGQSRVFVKLRYGSSASGVVALATSKDQVQATTSVEVENGGPDGAVRLFNSLRVRRYTQEREVAVLIDALCSREAHVESWIPKAGWGGTVFDLRVMLIAGEPEHVVMRTSTGPITNLHLGNRRGDIDSFLHELPATSREFAWNSCRRIAQVFPRSFYFGIDLLFHPGFQRHAIMEVNAFGDLLPGITFHGHDTYRRELLASRNRDEQETCAQALPRTK